MQICFDDCSTKDQMAQSPSSSPSILPDFESGRWSRPLSIFAAVVQASIPCLTQIGTATVRTLPPLPRRSMITHRPFPQLNSSILRDASSRRRRAQPTSRAMITWSRLPLWVDRSGTARSPWPAPWSVSCPGEFRAGERWGYRPGSQPLQFRSFRRAWLLRPVCVWRTDGH